MFFFGNFRLFWRRGGPTHKNLFGNDSPRQRDQFCQKIVIGQRLAVALSSGGEKNIFMNKIHSALGQDTPICLSTDRRTAALGAAWKAACS